MTQYCIGFENAMEYYTKPVSNIKKRSRKLKASITKPNHNNVKRKTIFATICILTLITLITVTEDLGQVKSGVKADPVTGIGVGIYGDSSCTNTTRSLNWGEISPNSNNNLTIYVRNEGNSAVSLRLTAVNWNPSNASSYMSLNWNYSGQNLKTNEVIPIKLTLTVSPSINDITDFSFDTIITSVDEH
jgi:hypothetical protein